MKRKMEHYIVLNIVAYKLIDCPVLGDKFTRAQEILDELEAYFIDINDTSLITGDL